MNWEKKEKNGKGLVGAQVFDANNQLLFSIQPKKFSLNEGIPTRLGFSFKTANVAAGTYRIDVLWNDKAVRRTFFSIVE